MKSETSQDATAEQRMTRFDSRPQHLVDVAMLGVRKLALRGTWVKKRRKKQFEAGKEARRRARASGINPAATRVIPDKRKRPPKHKKDLLEGET